MIMLMKMMMMRWEENELQRVTSCKSENPKSHRWHRDSEWIEKPVESESLPDCTKLHQKVLLLDSNLMVKNCNNFVCHLWKRFNAITSNQWDVWGVKFHILLLLLVTLNPTPTIHKFPGFTECDTIIAILLYQPAHMLHFWQGFEALPSCAFCSLEPVY